MQYRYLFFVQFIILIAIVVISLIGSSQWVIIAAITIALLNLLLLFISVSRPLRVVSTGISLLRGQDYASRLRHVGQVDADRMADFFNSLMDCLKTERLKLKEQNHFLQQIMSVSPMGIAVCDLDGRIIESNQAFRTLASPSVVDCLLSLCSGESVIVRESSYPILRCSHFHFMDSGFSRSFYLVERLTEEIISAERRMMSKIVRTMGHEVNNTLGAVVSVLESLEEIHRNDDLTLAQIIEASSISCRNLAEFMRGYSSLVKLPAPLLQEVEIDSFISELLPCIRQMADMSTITFRYEPGADNSTIMIDPLLMERVMVNVVKNALDSIGSDSGYILISTTHNSISITDSGKGLSPEAARKVFTPFFSTKHPDRGLGLMLVADILRSHSATFSLTTDPASHLTTFSIKF